MPKYLLFLDDSSNDGAILDKEFQMKPIQPEITGDKTPGLLQVFSAGGVLLREKFESTITQEIQDLKSYIQQRYQLSKIPPIHMRLLWGPTARHDKGRNPYYLLKAQDRFDIARKYYELLSSFCKRGMISLVDDWVDIGYIQKHFYDFYNMPRSLDESRIIAGHFKKGSKSYFKSVLNPTSRLIAGCLCSVNCFLEIKNSQVVVYYDDSHASRGFDREDIFKSFSSVNKLHKIQKHVITISANHSLIELADLVSYMAFRKGMSLVRGKSDQGIDNLLEGLYFAYIAKKDDWANRGLTVSAHYLIATQHLRDKDAQWVNSKMITPLQLLEKMSVPFNDSKEAGRGVHVLLDSVVEEYKNTQMSRGRSTAAPLLARIALSDLT